MYSHTYTWMEGFKEDGKLSEKRSFPGRWDSSDFFQQAFSFLCFFFFCYVNELVLFCLRGNHFHMIYIEELSCPHGLVSSSVAETAAHTSVSRTFSQKWWTLRESIGIFIWTIIQLRAQCHSGAARALSLTAESKAEVKSRGVFLSHVRRQLM